MIVILHCNRCGYDWVSRKKDGCPVMCPNLHCHSKLWNVPRNRQKQEVYDYVLEDSADKIESD